MFFVQKKYKPFFAYLFIILNIIVYFVEFYIQSVYGKNVFDAFIEYYGISMASLMGNNLIFSFLLSPFLHANFMHIAFNMLFLLQFGPRIEEEIGNLDFLLLYVLGAAASDFFSIMYIIIFHKNIIIIGASGALFALFAFYSIYFNGLKGFKGFIVFFIFYHLIMIYLLKVNIAFAAHLGGSIAGFLYYYFYLVTSKNKLLDSEKGIDE